MSIFKGVIMKASDAKEKVCPFIQRTGSVELGFNQGNSSAVEQHSRNRTPVNIKCICGDCMAWVYTKEENSDDEEIKEIEKPYLHKLKSLHVRDPMFGDYLPMHGMEDKIAGIQRELDEKINEYKHIDESCKQGYCQRLSGN